MYSRHAYLIMAMQVLVNDKVVGNCFQARASFPVISGPGSDSMGRGKSWFVRSGVPCA